MQKKHAIKRNKRFEIPVKNLATKKVGAPRLAANQAQMGEAGERSKVVAKNQPRVKMKVMRNTKKKAKKKKVGKTKSRRKARNNLVAMKKRKKEKVIASERNHQRSRPLQEVLDPKRSLAPSDLKIWVCLRG